MKHSKILVMFFALAFVFVLSGVTQQQSEEMVTCPVSGEKIKKAEAAATYEYEGKIYYFCCEKCKEEFVKNPEKYLQKKEEMKEIYTCPMHPEVKSDKPGECPKCGMKLEKKMMSMETMHTHMKMQEGSEEKTHCCPMMEMMSSKDIEIKVENLEDGAAVKITSKKADVVKMIQEKTAKMKEMCQEASCHKEIKKEEKKE